MKFMKEFHKVANSTCELQRSIVGSGALLNMLVASSNQEYRETSLQMMFLFSLYQKAEEYGFKRMLSMIFLFLSNEIDIRIRPQQQT